MADDVSNWIAGGAAVVAFVALALGEWRALDARRDARERNLVNWTVVWDEPEALRILNRGPDSACNVYARLSVQGDTYEAEGKRLGRSESLTFAVPGIGSAWDATPARGSIEGLFKHPVNFVLVDVALWWQSPRGRQQYLEMAQRPVPVTK